MSLYIRVQSSFWNHRKTLRLKALIGDSAFWVPPRIWSYAAENQPDGDFSDYTSEELAMLVGYLGDAQAMLQAMHQAGFMELNCIHDWAEHNGYHSTFSDRAKKAAAARWSKKGKGLERIGLERKGGKHCLSNAQAMLQAFPALQSGEIPTEWDAFVLSRKKMGHELTRRASELILGKLAERVNDAAQALRTAIENNWRGFEWEWFDKRRNGSAIALKRQGGASLRQEQLDRIPVVTV